MLYIGIGFIFGFFIPYLARRFSKFMPATFAYALYDIFRIKKHLPKQKLATNHQYILLRHRYFMRSLGWGITTTALSFLITTVFSSTDTPWFIFYTIILCLLMEIDKRMFLLPDLLTIPLLIGGFSYAAFNGNILGDTTALASENSCLGAIFGYFLPVIASLFLIRKSPDVFGGGDIKLLSAVGAWLGITNIPFVILLSSLIFGINCFIKKQRQDAFGPSISIASIIMLFIQAY